MGFFSWLFGRKTTPVRDANELKEAVRLNPQSPDAYYELCALPGVSYDESAEHYEQAVKLDSEKSKNFFPYHWAFALKAAQRQYRGPCIDAFTRALIVDAKRFQAGRASLDPTNRFVCAAWEQAKEEVGAYSKPASDKLLWNRD